jgi:hypothetical protein
MKLSLQIIFLALACLPSLASGVSAQTETTTTEKRVVATLTAQEDLFRAVETKFGFELNIVKGAPYSALVETETVQLLGDGNRITNKTVSRVYRDSEGRVRRESVGVTAEVFIHDPTTGVSYVLDPQRRRALRSRPNVTPAEVEKLTSATTVQSDSTPQAATQPPVKKKKRRPPNTEVLGQQMVEGVLCEGQRTTTVIAAGEAGNELPLTIINEQWRSPELQVLVLTKHSDPRIGATTYRLTNIQRDEPDRALFTVPAGYRLRDNTSVPVNRKK